MIADPMGDALRLVHVVRGQEYGDAFRLVEPADVRPQLVAALRIEPERRFVKEQDLRRVQQAAGDFQPALHAARKRLDSSVRAGPTTRTGSKEPRIRSARTLARDVVEHAVQVHVLVGGQLVIEAGVLEHDAEAPADLQRDCAGSRPSIVMEPLVGRRSVVSICMVVVLPAPFGPRKAKISPGRTSNEMPPTARTSPYDFTRF